MRAVGEGERGGARSRAGRRSDPGREEGRVAVGGPSETTTRSPARIGAPASSTSRVAKRSTRWRRAPGAATPRRRSPAARAPHAPRASASASPSTCQTRLAIMPSVVSMPPNSRTAAFETTRRRPARRAAAASIESPGAASCRLPRTAVEVGERLTPGRRHRLAGGDRVDGADDALVPAERGRRIGRAQAQRPRHGGDGERPGQRPAHLRLPGRRDRPEQPRGLVLDEGGEALAHRVEPERRAKGSRWRACSAPSSESMLGPTTCAVEKPGWSTVYVSASRITCSTRSRRVTSQAPRAGDHDTGSRSRRRACRGCGSASSSASVAAAPSGKAASRCTSACATPAG